MTMLTTCTCVYANMDVCPCALVLVRVTLQIDKFTRRTSTALQSVELVQAEGDEYVHFGDVLQVCDMAEKYSLSLTILCTCVLL